MSAITTHVLDVALGRPARGVPVVLERQLPTGDWQTLGSGATDDDGRQRALLPDSAKLDPGTYRLTFDAGDYFRATQRDGFYAQIPIVFVVGAGAQHYHVPLLLSPFGYSTYRGS